MEMVERYVKQMRKDDFDNSNQISLGQLIQELKEIAKNERKEEPYVQFDFGNIRPAGLTSYRGYYDELAICYDEQTEQPLLSEFIKTLENAKKETFFGWKGGEYKMYDHTPVWVSNTGQASDTAVVGVIDKGFRVLLQTQNMDT